MPRHFPPELFSSFTGGSPDTDEIAFVVSRSEFIKALHVFLVNLADARLS